jgi:hypothetical protein
MCRWGVPGGWDARERCWPPLNGTGQRKRLSRAKAVSRRCLCISLWGSRSGKAPAGTSGLAPWDLRACPAVAAPVIVGP